jgi:hypothetical protein
MNLLASFFSIASGAILKDAERGMGTLKSTVKSILVLKYILLAAIFSCSAHAENKINNKDGAEAYPVRPDGQRDWSANIYRVENGQAVPIRPDGQRDWSANVCREKSGHIVPIRTDGQRDWKTPQYK